MSPLYWCLVGITLLLAGLILIHGFCQEICCYALKKHSYKMHEDDYMMFTCTWCGHTYESQNYN